MPQQPRSNIFFLDKSFNEDFTKSYTLNILVGSDSFSFVVYQGSQNKYLGIGCFYFQKNERPETVIKQSIRDHPWLNAGFKVVYFVFSSANNTLIPNSLFDVTKKDVYLKFNQTISPETIVQYDELQHTLTANVYALPEKLDSLAKLYWPSAKLLHASSVLIESLTINFKNVMDNKILYINVGHQHFELLNFKHGKLNFHNHFRYKTKEDFVYFLLAAMEQIGLNPEETNISFMGIIEKNDALFEIVFKYIRSCNFIDRNDTFNYTYVFDNVRNHHHYVLLNTLQCV